MLSSTGVDTVKEINRQKALARLKAARERIEKSKVGGGNGGGPSSTAGSSNGSTGIGSIVTSQASTSSTMPTGEPSTRSSADSVARSMGNSSAISTTNSTTNPIPSSSSNATSSTAPKQHRRADQPLDRIEPAKKFKNYIEYDFSKMNDTRGGFLADEEPIDSKDGMTLEDWKEKQRELEPALLLNDPNAPKCFECGSPELDFRIYTVFKARVCKACKHKFPEKYSLLTKTECREDYLLTDPELRDEEMLPHLEKPNPHKTSFNNMMLYLRFQVEEVAFKKWDGPEGLDAEYEKRVEAKRIRKDKKFLAKLKEMRRKTRAETITRKNNSGQHVHEWSAGMKSDNGMVKRRCASCGMEREELVM